MKRLILLALAAIGVRALLKRRQEEAAATWEPAPAPTATPADDLKAKLAESRSVDEPEPPAADDPDVDARRADVHARARQAMDELS